MNKMLTSADLAEIKEASETRTEMRGASAAAGAAAGAAAAAGGGGNAEDPD